MTPRLTRRRLLVGAGPAGFLTVVLAGRILLPGEPPYTRYTYASSHDTDTDDRRVRVAWYETYNGQFQEAHNASTETNATLVLDPGEGPAYDREASGPVVRIRNAMPGDAGTLVIGLLAEELPDGDDGADVWFRTNLRTNAENDVTEPELLDGDEDDPGDGTSGGELADALRVRLWMDDGPLGGACDGTLGPLESPFQSGSLASAFGTLGGGTRIADCLPQGRRRCIGFEWALPSDAGNAIQTDSVEFDLEFVGQSCGVGNPFTAGGGGA